MRARQPCWAILVWVCLMRSAAAQPPPAQPPAALALELDVAILNDPDFPPVTLAQANSMLAAAQEVLRTKMGYSGFTLRVSNKLSLQEFMATYAPADSPCMQSAKQRRVRVNDPNHFVPAATQFLKKWPLQDLQALLPDLPPGPATYEQMARALTQRQADNYAALAKLRTPQKNTPLLTEATTPLRSFAAWSCALAAQDIADVFITNTALINDLATEPSPHGVTRGALRVGASTAAYDRTALVGRAVVLSTFPVSGPFKELREASVEALPEAERLRILSTHVLAHELAHAIFKIPDVYDHPPGCLMTTRRNTTWPAADAEMQAHPEPCSGCAPYVSAKRQVWRAQSLATAGALKEAIDSLRAGIKATPAHVEGSYNAYAAGLYQQLASFYDSAKDRDSAVRMVGEAALLLANDPPARVVLHPSTKALYERLLNSRE